MTFSLKEKGGGIFKQTFILFNMRMVSVNGVIQFFLGKPNRLFYNLMLSHHKLNFKIGIKHLHTKRAWCNSIKRNFRYTNHTY